MKLPVQAAPVSRSDSTQGKIAPRGVQPSPKFKWPWQKNVGYQQLPPDRCEPCVQKAMAKLKYRDENMKLKPYDRARALVHCKNVCP